MVRCTTDTKVEVMRGFIKNIHRRNFTCLVDILCNLGFNFSATFVSAGRKLVANLETAVSQPGLGPLHIQILIPTNRYDGHLYGVIRLIF